MSRRNLRQVPRINYYEPEEPSWDEHIYCDKCGDYVFEYCSIHGDLLVIPDDKVPAKTNFPSYVPRAALTIPHVFLHLAPSIIPGAGLGVFATLTLPRGVRFGPYRGFKTQEINSMYGWQIYDRNYKPSHVVDAANANQSNWMRYVNCSRHWCEQNLVAYQYQGQVYYRTIRIIPRFTELMVFYGGEFADRLGVDLGRYNLALPREQKFGEPAEKKLKTEQNKPTNAINENTIEKGRLQASKPKCKNIKKPIIKCKTGASKAKCNNFKNPVLNNKIIINKGNSSDQNNNKKITDSNMILTNCINHCETSNIKLKEHNVSQQNITNNYEQNNIVKDGGFKTNASSKEKLACDVNKKPPSTTQVASHKCNICEKSFTGKSYLVRHTRIHTGELPYKCNTCHKRYNDKENLVKHIRVHTGEKPYKCDICEKRFNDKETLVKHTRLHTGEKPFECNICHKQFNQNSSLIQHTRIHTGEKPFECDYCHKQFNHKGHLVKHTRIHTGEKPYKCNICEKRFTVKGSLVDHTRIHTGEKPFECDYCHKQFNQKSSLVRHTRSHTGEKPYKCDICDKKFSCSSNMKTHLKVHM